MTDTPIKTFIKVTLFYVGDPKVMMLKSIIALCLCVAYTVALDNGLARTPPMGWMSWERFRCNIDCKEDPDNCISQKLYTDMADKMAEEGYKEAGYEYVIVDDCWMNKTRDSLERLQPDHDRFPNGIKWLSDYVHAKGLKFGIYADYGTLTCERYPGSLNHLAIDAKTFAEWGVDYLKVDGCYGDKDDFGTGYPLFGEFLNKTGRPILYSCSWPAYKKKDKDGNPLRPDYDSIAKHCNTWRNKGDISDLWGIVQVIVDYYGADKDGFAKYAKPGSFNDPDMLIIGNFGLSEEQQKSQMAFWSIMASPLIMSNDLRNIRPFSKSVLLNKGAIAINQDVLGIQGRRISKDDKTHMEIWTKPIQPTGDLAFLIHYSGSDRPKTVMIDHNTLGLDSTSSYFIEEVFDGIFITEVKPGVSFKVKVNPSGVFFGRASKTS